MGLNRQKISLFMEEDGRPEPSNAKLNIGLQNLEPVSTMVLLWRFTMPHVALLAIMLGPGFVLGVTVAVMLGAKYMSE
jgi:hypothetical protein